MSNLKYDREEVLRIIAEYIIKEALETDATLPVEKLYDKIVCFAADSYSDEWMPKFSQARKIIISELTAFGKYNRGERFDVSVLYRLKDIYYNNELIEEVVRNEYEVSCYTDTLIICTIKLPPTEIMTGIFSGISEKKERSEMWGKIDSIRKICDRVKKHDPDNILAVIPESNRMVYLNGNGKINNKMNELDPICDTLLMFVKNTPAGRNLVDAMKAIP